MADLIERDAVLKTMSSANIGGYITDKIMSIPAVNRWISVEDALPEEDVSVLCYMRIGEIVVMEYGGDGWYCDCTRYNPRAVTHWMPLPEPPEVTQDDNG